MDGFRQTEAAPDADEGVWEVVVVGSGPAGLAAALMLGRYRRRTLVFDECRPRNAATHAIHGLPGLDGVSPAELRRRAWEQIGRYADVERRDERVTGARRDTDGQFQLETAGGQTVRARRLLLATGVQDVRPDDVADFDSFYGSSIHHCPDCDGYEASGKRVAVISWGREAAGYALELLNWTAELVLLTHGHPDALPAEHVARLGALGIAVEHRRLARFEGRAERLSGIRLADGEAVACEAAYFHIGQRPCSELARQLGCRLNEQGHVDNDRRQRTSVSDVFVAGDLAPPDETVAVAMAQGQVAAIVINQSLYPPERRIE